MPSGGSRLPHGRYVTFQMAEVAVPRGLFGYNRGRVWESSGECRLKLRGAQAIHRFDQPLKVPHLPKNEPSPQGVLEEGRWSEILTGHLGVYTLVFNLGTILFAVSTFVVVALMPTIAADIGGLRYYSWTFALFSVGSMIGAAGTGPVREGLGHRIAFAGAGLVFIAGLAGAALAPNMQILIFWRLIQGIGGGAINSQVYALIAHIYPEQLRGRALSLLSTAWGVATVLGPTFGGLFAEFGAWRAAFWVLALLSLVFACLAWRVIPPAESKGRLGEFPVTRLALLGASVLGLSLTSQIDANEMRAVLVVVSVLVAAIAFRRDRRAPHTLFPRQAMALTSEMGAAFWIMMLASSTVIIINMYVTLYLQVLHGVSPLVAAYLYVTVSVSWSASAFIVAAWQGTRMLVAIVVGLVLMAVGVAGVALVVAEGPVFAIVAFLAVVGAGMGFITNPLIQHAIAAAAPDERAATGSSVPAIRTLGHSFGAALAGLIAAMSGFADEATPEILAPAMERVHALGTFFPVLALLIAVILIFHARRPAGD